MGGYLFCIQINWKFISQFFFIMCRKYLTFEKHPHDRDGRINFPLLKDTGWFFLKPVLISHTTYQDFIIQHLRQHYSSGVFVIVNNDWPLLPAGGTTSSNAFGRPAETISNRRGRINENASPRRERKVKKLRPLGLERLNVWSSG